MFVLVLFVCRVLLEGMQEKIPLPKFSFGVAGAFATFDLKLRFLADYEDLPDVYKALQVVGNCMAFLYLIDKALVRRSSLLYSRP